MKFLCMYDEFNPGAGLPSMRDFFQDGSYKGKDAIVKYLKTGRKTYAKTNVPKDVFTGEKISFESCGMTDGVYSWLNTLSYYVEKYNLRLPKEFETYVLERNTYKK